MLPTINTSGETFPYTPVGTSHFSLKEQIENRNLERLQQSRSNDEAPSKKACIKKMRGPQSENSSAGRSIDQVLEDSLHSATTNNGQCFNYQLRWRYWRLFWCLGICNAADASEILCLSYLLANDQFAKDVLNPQGGEALAFRASCLASAVFVGMFVGGLLVSSSEEPATTAVSERRFGRKPALLIGLATNAGAGICSAFLSNLFLLSLCRFVAGVGIGYLTPVLFTLCSEITPSMDRGFWSAFVAGFWMVGSVFVAISGWIVLGNGDTFGTLSISSWRILALICAAPSLLGYWLVTIYVPESPRYLATVERYQEAVEVVERLTIETLQYRGCPWTLQEAIEQYPNSRQQQQLESEVGQHFSGSAPFHRADRSLLNGRTSISLLYHNKLWRTTIPLQGVWFGLSFGGYGLLTWINSLFVQIELQNIYFNALLFSLANLPGNILSVVLLDRVGRSSLLIGSLSSATLSLVAFAYIASMDVDNYKSDDASYFGNPKDWIVWSACVFQACTVVAWNVLAVLTPESYPTSMRSTGTGFCSASGRVGGIVAQIVNGYTLQKPVLLLLIAAITMMGSAASPLILPKDMTGQSVDGVRRYSSVQANGSDDEDQRRELAVLVSSQESVRDGETVTYQRRSISS